MYDAVKHHMKVSFWQVFYFFFLNYIIESFQAGLADIKKSDFIEWILKHPGQIVLTISQVIYTKQVNQTFDSSSTQIDKALIQTRDQMITTINNVCSLVYAKLEQTKLLTVEALLTLQVHWRDIFEMLIKHNVRQRIEY